jgi:hypothetical protein
MKKTSFYATAIRLIGVYLLLDSIYSLVSMALFYYQPWPEDEWGKSLLYFFYQFLPFLLSLFVIYRAEYLVRVLKLEGAEGLNASVDFGKWDLKAIVELAVVLLSGYLILMNIVPFIAAIIDYFVDFVRLKYPYNTEPDQLAYRDQYNFITGGISILLGVIILTNVPWFVGKIIGKYADGVKE